MRCNPVPIGSKKTLPSSSSVTSTTSIKRPKVTGTTKSLKATPAKATIAAEAEDVKTVKDEDNVKMSVENETAATSPLPSTSKPIKPKETKKRKTDDNATTTAKKVKKSPVDSSAAQPVTTSSDSTPKEAAGVSIDEGSVQPTKVTKKEVDVSGVDFKQQVQAGTISKLSIPQLKAHLKELKLKVGGNKTELVQRVVEHYKQS